MDPKSTGRARTVEDPASGSQWVEVGDAIEKYWAPVLAFVGVILFTVRYLSYLAFYGRFGVSPEEVGLGYSEALLQAIIATTFLAAAMGLYVGSTARNWGVVTLSLARVFMPRKLREALQAGGRRVLKRRWLIAGVGVAVVVVAFQVYLVVGGLVYGSKAQSGEPLGDRTPQSYLEWHAERVKVRLVGDQIAGVRLAPKDCTLYLGKAEGTVVLWNWTEQVTVRIPASDVVLEMGQAQKPCTNG